MIFAQDVAYFGTGSEVIQLRSNQIGVILKVGGTRSNIDGKKPGFTQIQ